MSSGPDVWGMAQHTTDRYDWVYQSVAPIVDNMTPYEEIATPADLHADCEAVRRALQPAPSLHFDDYAREIPKGQIEVTEAAQRLANALHLHLD